MAKQLLLLVAVTLGIGADAETKPPGTVVTVDDDIAEALTLSVPPAAQLDNSEQPAAPAKSRTRRAATPTAAPLPSGEGEDGSTSGAADGTAVSSSDPQP
jgi:hypothetical protein